MNQAQLEQIISAALNEDPFAISGADLQSESIAILFHNFLMAGQLLLNEAVRQPDNGSEIIITGRFPQVFLGQANLQAEARFRIVAEQVAVVIHLSAVPTSWKPSTSFNELQGTLLEQFHYNNVVFTLDSQLQSDLDQVFQTEFNWPATPEDVQAIVKMGLSLSATAVLADLQSDLAWLLSGTGFDLSGPIELAAMVPRVYLTFGINGHTTIGSFEFPIKLKILSNFLKLSDPAASVVLTSFSSLQATLEKVLDAGTLLIPISAEFYGADYSILFFRSRLNGLPNILFSEISQLIENTNIIDQVPDDFPSLSEIELRTLNLVVNLRARNLIGVSLTVGYKNPDEKWEPFGELVRFHGMAVTFSVSNPITGPRMLETSMVGKADFAGGTLAGEVLLPDKSFACELIDGSIDIKSAINSILSQAIDMPAMSCMNLRFFGNVTAQSYRYLAGIETDWMFQVGSGHFTIKEIDFDLSHGLNDGGTSGSIAGKFMIAENEIFVSAAYADDGWLFGGETGSGHEISFSGLLLDLENVIGEVQRPEVLADLTIQNLGVSFHTRSKDFHFQCAGAFTLGPDSNARTITTLVMIDITRQLTESGARFDKHFSGALELAGKQFRLTFDQNGGSRTFIADYDDPDGTAIAIQPLIEALFTSQDLPPDAAVDLSITLNEALAAYHHPVAASDGIKVFGLDIGAGVDLSALTNLPLIGGVLPPRFSAKLAVQLLAASADLDQSAVAALAGLRGEGSLTFPATISAGLHLSVSLRLGRQTKILDLPVGLDSGTGQTIEQPSDPPASTPDVTAPTPTGSPPEQAVKWFKIQKNLGPLHFEQIGLAFVDPNLTLLLDASLAVGGLTIALVGLGLTLSKDDLTDHHFTPQFSLAGLGIDYRNGPVELGGSFLRQTVTPPQGEPYDAFAGLAVLKMQTFSLGVIGSYAAFEGHPSLFIYGVLNYPLGGPSFFFVTGLAAGFGYNRRLRVPAIGAIANFALVQQAVTTPPSLPNDGSARRERLNDELTALAQYVTPALGEDFLAVGVKFTSFKIIESFALLLVQFGKHFEIDLLGLSTLVVPPRAGQTPLAEAQLALRAVFAPEEGILGVQAQLTDASYLLSRRCHLTGGFAFFSWFKDDPTGAADGYRAGDFVLTLGGYHPAFAVPAYYPRVPRLGINWQVNDQLSIKGGEYYALTGHALMAGGSLEAVWHDGELRAWFKAAADFLIQWKPYHYDLRASVDMGVSFTVHFFGTHQVSLDVGADLHIWGPEFAGEAEIHVKVFGIGFDFEVSFGDDSSDLAPVIDWDEFRDSFLPQNPDQVCAVSVLDGLQQQSEAQGQAGASEHWIVNPKDLILGVHTVVPVKTALGVNDADISMAVTDFGIAPMGLTGAEVTKSELVLSLQRLNSNTGAYEPVEAEFAYTAVTKALPAALWGEPAVVHIAGAKYLPAPAVNDASLIEATLAGFELRPAHPPAPGVTHDVARQNLAFETHNASPDFTLQPGFEVEILQGVAAWRETAQSFLATATVQNRNALFDELSASFQLGEVIIDLGQPVTEDLSLVLPIEPGGGPIGTG